MAENDKLKELAKGFKEFCDAGHGDYVFLHLDRPLTDFKAEVELDDKEVLDVRVRDGVVRKVKYTDEDNDLKRSDKFESNGVLDRIRQSRHGDREGLQVDKRDDEWKMECRTKNLSKDFKHFLLGPELGEVSDSVKALVKLVDPKLLEGLEKEKVYLEKDGDKVVVQVGKGKKAVKHKF